LAGANIIYGLGMLEMGMTFSLAQLMMDADIANMIRYTLGGVTVNDDTLSVDVTKAVGYKKDFLTHRNTFTNRNIQSSPKLIDRQMRNRWEEDGATTMDQRALTLATSVLETHQPVLLSAEVKAAVHQVVNDTERERALEVTPPMA
jgi:Trimethylamine:corrinoid methyltransferase